MIISLFHFSYELLYSDKVELVIVIVISIIIIIIMLCSLQKFCYHSMNSFICWFSKFNCYILLYENFTSSLIVTLVPLFIFCKLTSIHASLSFCIYMVDLRSCQIYREAEHTWMTHFSNSWAHLGSKASWKHCCTVCCFWLQSGIWLKSWTGSCLCTLLTPMAQHSPWFMERLKVLKMIKRKLECCWGKQRMNLTEYRSELRLRPT